jgi:O-acetyl-ADP-ribose deacetylase (regulator of RNase III)
LNSLRLAVQHSVASIAFPAISTGAFGYPLAEAAEVSSQAILNFLEGDKTVKEIRLVFFKPSDLAGFLKHHKFS